MFNLKFITENEDKVAKTLKLRNVPKDKVDLDKLFKLDEGYKATLKEVEDLRHEQKEANKKIVKLDEKEKKAFIAELKKKSDKLKKLESKMKKKKIELDSMLAWIPNILADDVPEGKDDSDNLELKAWRPDGGYIDEKNLGKGAKGSSKHQSREVTHAKDKKFKPKHHVDLGKELDLIDVKQSAKVSGSRFSYLKGDLVLLQRAVFDFMIDKLRKEGFTPVIPPNLVREEAMFGTSHFPGDQDQVYEIKTEGKTEEEKPLYLAGSSEPSLFAYFMGKTLKLEDLPQKLFAITTCFRSEAGSWGKDTKGIKRAHQFDKLEMDVVCTPEQSAEIFNELLEINEWMLQKLKLPYRVVYKCTGDAGYYATHKGWDWDYWLPGEGVYMEGGSLTNTTDYQARRLGIKYQDEKKSKRFAYTINDTAVTTRVLIAIMENYQQKDGSIKVPKVLQKYCGFKRIASG